MVDGEADEGNKVRQNPFATSTLHSRLLQCRVGLPKLRFVPEIRWLLDGVGQFLDALEKALPVWSTIENLERGDFVLMLLDKLLKRLHNPFCPS
jgi:hypothetical protein